MTQFNDAFWRWFGDSKVVDGKGNPLVVYHGTGEAGISVFKTGTGAWFSTDSDLAAAYSGSRSWEGGAPTLYSVYLRMTRPLKINAESRLKTTREELAAAVGFAWSRSKKIDRTTGWPVDWRYVKVFQFVHTPEFVRAAANEGYDGIIMPEGRALTFGVFSPTQIKSATGNDGTWDADDPDITSNPGNPPLTPKELQMFKNLAYGQRGAPESAMQAIQESQIAQLYDWVAEHVGDLTHRMSESPEYMRGGFSYVREKVEKTLRALSKKPPHDMPFEQDVAEQIVNNTKYRHKHGIHGPATPEEAEAELRGLGALYADAHRELPVFNEVQTLARDAAVAVGEFDFNTARDRLSVLKRYLDRGQKVWDAKALEVSDDPDITSNPPARGNPEYSGSHAAPGHDGYSAPLYDVSSTGIYPVDIYGPHGAQYYGHYGNLAQDSAAIRVIRDYHHRPNAFLTVYRAVPAQNADKLLLLEKQMREFMRRGKTPENSRLSGSAWYNDAYEVANALRAAPAEEILTINPGDWVTTVRAYAVEHGEATLEGAYRVISKKVRARELWTDGNSIFEFGYDPSGEPHDA